jgi:glycosyltransferase involved in cell wall biosynthesis
MTEKPLVSILCATYNQKDFIAQTIEGFLMQKVNFPIEIIVHDDASTDGTADIVRKYEAEHPNLIKGIYQTENQYSKKTGIWQNFIYPRATGKYYAECEGDDYWSDPDKLQKQVDFLETHPEYSACVHRCKCLNCKTNSFGTSFPNETQERDFSINEIILGGGGFWGTNTVVCRPVFLPDYEAEFWKLSPVGDFPHALSLATHGKIHYLPQEMSVYRLFAKGSWSSRTMIGPEAYNRRSTHVSKMRESLKAFDKHTNFEFSKFIQEKIDLNDFNLYWDFGKWSLLKTTSHYKQRSFIGKLKALYHCISIFFKKAMD